MEIDKYALVDPRHHITGIWRDGGDAYFTEKNDLYKDLFEEFFPRFPGGTIIEVGPGSGLFARWLLGNFSIPLYTILDLEKNIYHSRHTLRNFTQCEFITSDYYETLLGREWDLFISNVCLSETPDYYRENLVRLATKCQSVFIIDGDECIPGYNDWLKREIGSAFPTSSYRDNVYKSCMIIAGYK